jgi:hypothetical protein
VARASAVGERRLFNYPSRYAEEVKINRREVVQGMALGAVPLLCRSAPARARWRAHGRTTRPTSSGTQAGPKFSGGPGDNATAQWIADELRGAGYEVQ